MLPKSCLQYGFLLKTFAKKNILSSLNFTLRFIDSTVVIRIFRLDLKKTISILFSHEKT